MPLPTTFRCLYVTRNDAKEIQRQITSRPLDELPAGEVLVQVAFSSLNYKDALSASGHPGVTRKFPHVPGIDAAGTVADSSDPRFQPGQSVLVTGFDMGQNTWGGFAEFIRVPADWVVPLPAGLSLRESMIFGTAGLTAALSVQALCDHGLKPDGRPVLVTGATGGVGSTAVAILAHAGFHVVAATGKPEATDFLRQLGAAEIVGRDAVYDPSNKPLLNGRWAGAVDTVGGNTLATVVRSMERAGCVACSGLVGGIELPLTVYPFILRGVALVGIDSAECPPPVRTALWAKMASAWKPAPLETIVARTVTIDQLEEPIATILKGGIRGRVLVTPR